MINSRQSLNAKNTTLNHFTLSITHVWQRRMEKLSVAEKDNSRDGVARLLHGDNIILVETSFIVADG